MQAFVARAQTSRNSWCSSATYSKEVYVLEPYWTNQCRCAGCMFLVFQCRGVSTPALLNCGTTFASLLFPDDGNVIVNGAAAFSSQPFVEQRSRGTQTFARLVSKRSQQKLCCARFIKSRVNLEVSLMQGGCMCCSSLTQANFEGCYFHAAQPRLVGYTKTCWLH